jgi:hypothetical protein
MRKERVTLALRDLARQYIVLEIVHRNTRTVPNNLKDGKNDKKIRKKRSLKDYSRYLLVLCDVRTNRCITTHDEFGTGQGRFGFS